MLAFAVPIVPGKEDEFQAFARDLGGDNADNFAAFNSRHGISMHEAWLQTNPDGSQLVVVVLDGEGADGFLGSLATSEAEEDQWFRDAIVSVHGIDFSQPPPPPNQKVV